MPGALLLQPGINCTLNVKGVFAKQRSIFKIFLLSVFSYSEHRLKSDSWKRCRQCRPRLVFPCSFHLSAWCGPARRLNQGHHMLTAVSAAGSRPCALPASFSLLTSVCACPSWHHGGCPPSQGLPVSLPALETQPTVVPRPSLQPQRSPKAASIQACAMCTPSLQ